MFDKGLLFPGMSVLVLHEELAKPMFKQHVVSST